MKTGLLLTFLTAATSLALADDLAVETAKTAETPREQPRKIEAARPKKGLEESPVTYGGFLTDFSRAERKSRFLSLRQPLDPKNDYKHLALDERTARPRGFILFSLSF